MCQNTIPLEMKGWEFGASAYYPEGYWDNSQVPRGHDVTLGKVFQLSAASIYSSVKLGYTTCFTGVLQKLN